MKQQSEYIDNIQVFDVEERKQRILRKAQEDEINGVPKIKVEETVDEKARNAEDNPLSEKNVAEVGKAIAEDKVFDALADKLTSDKVDEVITDAIADISESEKSVADAFMGELIADGMSETVSAGATLAV